LIPLLAELVNSIAGLTAARDATLLILSIEGKDIVLAGQKSGEVFGLDPDNSGKILWRRKLGRGGIQGGVHFGMAVDGDTLDGKQANGGSLGGAAGPVFKGDMMFISSGYGIYFHMPGNVLLAFGPAD
jgi:outer membrane protein assembly factor BamB